MKSGSCWAFQSLTSWPPPRRLFLGPFLWRPNEGHLLNFSFPPPQNMPQPIAQYAIQLAAAT